MARQELVTTSETASPIRLLPSPRSVEPPPPDDNMSWFREALLVLSERRRLILGVIGLGTLTLIAYAALVPAKRIFEARAQMLVEPESSPLDYGRPAATGDPEGSYYETQYRILHSRALVRLTLATLASKDGKPPSVEDTKAVDAISTGAIDAFLATLSIANIPNSRLVEVRVKSPDPAYAARAANAHAQAYIKQSVDRALAASRQASRWLAGEIDDERARLERGAGELDRQRQRDGTLEERQAMVTQRLSELNASLLRARAQRVAKETVFQQIDAAQKAGASPRDLATHVPTSLVQQLSLDLAAQQRRELELSASYGERHPERIKAREAVEFAEQRLDTEVNNAIEAMRRDVQAARADENRLARALEDQTTESSKISRKAVDYESLKRDVGNDRSLLERLQQRARELRLSNDYELSNVKIIDPAEVPRQPLPDTKWRNLALGGAGSVAFALMLAFGVHYLDERLRSPEDIKTHLGLPYLGMVPKVEPRAIEPGSSGVGMIKRVGMPLPFKEAMRDLRTHVLCTPSGRAAKILLVTSTNSEEGKTLVATNLATGMAQVGNSVLLIDLDLRRPSVHRSFDLPVQPGLSELLAGTVRGRDPIRPTEIRGLSVLPAGKPLTNPGDLIGSTAFKQLMQTLSQRFDRIVIDSPPVMAVTDASLIAHEEVGVLFVVSADRTGRRPAQAALDRLEAVGARFVGVVLNRVDLKQTDSPYYLRYDDTYGDGTYEDGPLPPDAPTTTTTTSTTITESRA
jgi:succinoglycan biosynthesis transport protein ExoP